ncbi:MULTISPECIES: hypothetical protein [Rodentibacter]|uniref:hypothetical protein n=1 Tax=Rodentibacter TaxID=1960084 RepID=UPI001CFCE6C9|nr:hypothetical protein [Rodentibacter sp. JRC1]GJI56186.1 hypothetical protein HEMROJRC1_12980 [Rodentibacter sp. JRC1]
MYYGLDNETQEKKFYKVEGQIIFSLAFTDYQPNCKIKWTKPNLKIVIHKLENNNLILIIFNRIRTKKDGIYHIHLHSIDDASWLVVDIKVLTKQTLLNWVDCISDEGYIRDISFINRFALPFLVRQALINNGILIDNIINIPNENPSGPEHPNAQK